MLQPDNKQANWIHVNIRIPQWCGGSPREGGGPMDAHSSRRLQTNRTLHLGEMAGAGRQHATGNKRDENTGVRFFFHVWKCQEKWPENQRGNAKEGERHEGGRERKIEWRMNVV